MDKRISFGEVVGRGWGGSNVKGGWGREGEEEGMFVVLPSRCVKNEGKKKSSEGKG